MWDHRHKTLFLDYIHIPIENKNLQMEAKLAETCCIQAIVSS